MSTPTKRPDPQAYIRERGSAPSDHTLESSPKPNCPVCHNGIINFFGGGPVCVRLDRRGANDCDPAEITRLLAEQKEHGESPQVEISAVVEQFVSRAPRPRRDIVEAVVGESDYRGIFLGYMNGDAYILEEQSGESMSVNKQKLRVCNPDLLTEAQLLLIGKVAVTDTCPACGHLTLVTENGVSRCTNEHCDFTEADN